MYFTTENSDKTKLLQGIAVPITNDVSNEDLAVTEVIKVRFPDSIGGEGMATGIKMQDSLSKEGWVIVTTKQGRQCIPPGRYDWATGKTVSRNVTAADVDVETKIEAIVVKDKEYCDIFNVVDMDEIALSAIHHKEIMEFAMLVQEWVVGLKTPKNFE